MYKMKMFCSITHKITLGIKEIRTVADSAQKGPTTGPAAVRRQLRSAERPSPSAGGENKESRLLPWWDEGTLRPPPASAGQELLPTPAGATAAGS